MANTAFQLSFDLVQRKIQGQLAIVVIPTGKFLYFNLATEKFLQLFTAPRTWESALQSFPGLPQEESAHLDQFLKKLVEDKILLPHEPATQNPAPASFPYERPSLLREDSQGLFQKRMVHF